MISRSEASGLTIAVIGHVVLFGLLSVGFLATPNPESLRPAPIEVSLVDDVALESAAPELSAEPEAAKLSPVEAPVEPEAAPPEPVADPQPVAKPEPAPPKPSPDKADRRRPDRPAPSNATPSQRPNREPRPTGGLPDYAKEFGTGNRPNTSNTTKPPAAKMSAQAAADIASAIQRQVQPCADRQVSPGPGAERIRAVVNLKLNRDGSLAAPPSITGHDGVDDTNSRYVRRIDDAVKAIFAGCSPLRGLPDELYDIPNGWRSFTLRYRLKT